MPDNWQDMLMLHRVHLRSAGVPDCRVDAVDTIPATRTDLRDYYRSILSGAIETPEWAGGALKVILAAQPLPSPPTDPKEPS